MKIILINGPPRSGKDQAARHLESKYRAYHGKFSSALKDMVHQAYGLFAAPHDAFEEVKDQPCDEFWGITPRQAYIAFSEKFLKELHGKTVFGRILAHKIRSVASRGSKLAAISDSGFLDEALVLIDEFGAENCMLITLTRDGTSFSGDSRSKVVLPIKTVEVHNSGSTATLHAVLDEAVSEWVSEDRRVDVA